MNKGNKRSGGASGNQSYYNPRQKLSANPKRGAAGVFLTCETGREQKACREMLSILQQDWERHFVVEVPPSPDQASAVKSNEISSGNNLEKELEKLRRHPRGTSPFSVYETGCKGTVFILCTASRLIVQPRHKSDEGVEPAPAKKLKLETEKNPGDDEQTKAELCQGDLGRNDASTDAIVGTITQGVPQISWDPFEVIQRVVHDMESGDNKLTSSRFITRMIPIQASCYSSLEDIQHVVLQLLQPIIATGGAKSTSDTTPQSSGNTVIPKATTFAIQEKRRFCGHLKHDQIVETVGSVVVKCTEGWKVNLTTPDYTVWIEVCKNVAGISIIPASILKPKNFNLAELRDSLACAADAETEQTTTAEK